MKEATESIVKHLLTYILLLMLEGVCLAQTSLSVSDLSVPTKIAPAYFGPNAFPVPDMMTAGHLLSGSWRSMQTISSTAHMVRARNTQPTPSSG